jgi:hypothetical protein
MIKNQFGLKNLQNPVTCESFADPTVSKRKLCLYTYGIVQLQNDRITRIFQNTDKRSNKKMLTKVAETLANRLS